MRNVSEASILNITMISEESSDTLKTGVMAAGNSAWS